jgi:hypothetical protein
VRSHSKVLEKAIGIEWQKMHRQGTTLEDKKTDEVLPTEPL